MSLISCCSLLIPLARGQYQGGPASLSLPAAYTGTPVCPLPATAVSAIYSGGSTSYTGAAGILQAPACLLPGYGVSSIYGGGPGTGQASVQYTISGTCTVPVYASSSAYGGGPHSNAESAALLQSPTCTIPAYTSSSIYAGGAGNSHSSALVLQSPVCNIPASLPSPIYAGGAGTASAGAVVVQSPACALPPFVPSAIYAGGAGSGYTSVQLPGALSPSVQVLALDTNLCAGEQVWVRAVSQAGGTNPVYSWYLNGAMLPQDNDTIYISGLTDGSTLYATMTGNLPCAIGASTVYSDTLTFRVSQDSLWGNTLVPPALPFCNGNVQLWINGSTPVGPDTLSYLWQSSTSASFQPVQTFAGGLHLAVQATDSNRYFRRIVQSTTCLYADTSATVTLNPAAALTAVFPLDSTQGSCWVYYNDGWVDIPAQNDPQQLMVSVKDDSLSNDLLQTQVRGYIDPSVQTIQGLKVLQRHFDIVPVNSDQATIRLYFTETEFQALRAQSANISTIADLGIMKFPTGTTTSPVFITPVQAVNDTPFTGVHYLEFPVSGFSSFYIHEPPDPLPVSWGGLSVSCAKGTAVLSWTTFSEVNNALFRAEKSRDLLNWQTVAELPGAGNSNTPLQYTLHDESAGEGTWYYRVIQTDHNGQSSSSAPASASCAPVNDEAGWLHLYPNPAPGQQVNIRAGIPFTGRWTCTITGASGAERIQTVMELEAGIHTISLNIGTLAPGMYICEWRHGSGRTLSAPFIKTRQ